MRHHLFVETDVKLSQEMLLNIFNFYELLMFYPDSTTDIFLKYANKMHAHLKMRCNIVFGINLYYLLLKENLLESFKEELFCDNKQILPNEEGFFSNMFSFLSSKAVDLLNMKALIDNFKDAFRSENEQVSSDVQTNTATDIDSEYLDVLSLYKHLDYLRPLFRIVNVCIGESSKVFSITFNGAFKNMGYKYLKGNQICLANQIEKSIHEPVTFLNLFNEGNGIFRKSVRLDISAIKKGTGDLDTMISPLLLLISEIKALYLSTTANAEFNKVAIDNYTHYDIFLENLLSKSVKVLKHLNELNIYGFNKLSLTTILLIKQSKFERFGLRGIYPCVEELYLYLLFREESSETLEKLNKIYRDNNNLIKVDDAAKYNNLKNSVTHLTCTEDIFREAMRYCLLDNIQEATLHMHGNRRSYDLYPEEKCIEKLLKLHKENCNSVKTLPMSLKKLEVRPIYNYINDFDSWIRSFRREFIVSIKVIGMQQIFDRNLCTEYEQSPTCIYEVSEFMQADILRSFNNPEIMSVVSRVVNFRDSFAVSVTLNDVEWPNSFLNTLAVFPLNNKSIILRFAHNPFDVAETDIPFFHDYFSHLWIIKSLYFKYIHYSENATLSIVFHSQKSNELNTEEIRKQVCDYVIYETKRENNVIVNKSDLNKKISVEI
ncbi:hypothetical protein ENBRE01_1199 [Enteropsectra breve]|nr:hypothetical protein ENBRE01_1199 [Enteropsectra breve]